MIIQAREKSRSFSRMPSKIPKCMSYEDTLREMEAYLDGKLDNPQNNHDVYADITDPMPSSVVRQPESDDPDATENSSSFGDTESRNENASGNSEAEVESEYHVDHGLTSTLESFNSVFSMRKKKLTTHWRSFIQPLMWRCKWTELRIKELESQALKYSRELEANEQTKMLELHQYTSDFCSKSFPFFNHSSKRRVMKRRKRKLVENMTDISSYMSHHQLFAYLEKKRFDLDDVSVGDVDVHIDVHPKNDEFVLDDDWLRDGEESIEQVLRNIETAQSQVHRLISQLDSVMLKNGVKFSSYENLSLLAPYDAQTSAAQSPVFSAGNGDNISIDHVYLSEHLKDFDIEDLVLPESIVSSYGDGGQIPDIIESTVGLLSGEDVTINQPQVLESGENILDDTHIQNTTTLDGHVSTGGTAHPIGESLCFENNEKNISIQRDSITGNVIQENSTLKSCLTSEIRVLKNKRKRGERKAGPGAWNIRSTADHMREYSTWMTPKQFATGC